MTVLEETKATTLNGPAPVMAGNIGNTSQKQRLEKVLDELANAYAVYTHPTLSKHPASWVENRGALQGGVGGLLIDRCCESAEMTKSILKLVIKGLTTENENPKINKNAEIVCQMLDELYIKDPSIRKNINIALGGEQPSIDLTKGLGNLKDVLITKGVFDDVTRSEEPLTNISRPRR